MNPRAEREIALLRAEILDLEDQYYSLKSRCEGSSFAANSTSGMIVGQGGQIINQGVIDPYCNNCVTNPTTLSNSVIYQDAPGFIQNNQTEITPFNDSSLDTSDQFLDEPAIDSIEGSGNKLERLPPADGSGEDQSSIQNTRGLNSIMRPASARNTVSSIIINRDFSKGQDVDGLPGHEGLSLLLQPITVMGEVRKLAGHLTVRVVESGGPQVERQIGLWQFTPEETTSFFVKDEFAQQGILLHLPWDGMAPTGRQLDVFVRFVTPDQQNIEASINLPIDPPRSDYSPDDPLVAGWIERDQRWVDIPLNANSVLNRGQQPVLTERAPEFRVKSPTTERRTSSPQWRPVR